MDPRKMCQRLVSTVDLKRALKGLSPEEVITLFEDWIEEVENYLLKLSQGASRLSTEELAQRLGLSERSLHFLLKKLRLEGKL